MISYAELIQLERRLRDAPVLSVFLEEMPEDPAMRHGWHVQITDAIREVRDTHALAGPVERGRLEQAIDRFERHLAALGSVRSHGWVGYFGPDRTHLAEALPVAVSTVLSWGRGAWVAPLLRALKESRPAIVGIVDSRAARLYRYREGVAVHVDTLRAPLHTEAVSHMGSSAAAGFHGGTRGRSGKDQLDRERLAARKRMWSTLSERMIKLAGADGWLLIGGAPIAAREARSALPPREAARSYLLADLRLGASLSEIAHSAASGASFLRRQEDLGSVRYVMELAGQHGRGVIGLASTLEALEQHCVARLYMSIGFVDHCASDAERTARAAFDQGAPVEVVAGAGGSLLDARAGGIAGALHYATPAEAVEVPADLELVAG